MPNHTQNYSIFFSLVTNTLDMNFLMISNLKKKRSGKTYKPTLACTQRLNCIVQRRK